MDASFEVFDLDPVAVAMGPCPPAVFIQHRVGGRFLGFVQPVEANEPLDILLPTVEFQFDLIGRDIGLGRRFALGRLLLRAPSTILGGRERRTAYDDPL